MNSIDSKNLSLIVLTGHRKSGTSLLHRLFDGHSSLNIYPVDISVLYAYFPCFTNNSKLTNKDLTERLLHVLCSTLKKYNYNNKAGITKLNLLFNYFKKEIQYIDIRRRKDVINAIASAWSLYSEKNVLDQPFLFKETTQAIFLDYFLEEYPDLKMISLIRDPRDNYAAIKSGVNKYYSNLGEDDKMSLSSILNRVRTDLKAANINQKKHKKSFIAIRFEDLVLQTEKTLKKLTNFLEIDFNEFMLKPSIMGKPYHGNSHEGKIFDGISRENVNNWKSRISAEEAKIIEYSLEDQMIEWGYELQYSQLASQRAYAKFYEWNNCKYFYHDSHK